MSKWHYLPIPRMRDGSLVFGSYFGNAGLWNWRRDWNFSWEEMRLKILKDYQTEYDAIGRSMWRPTNSGSKTTNGSATPGVVEALTTFSPRLDPTQTTSEGFQSLTWKESTKRVAAAAYDLNASRMLQDKVKVQSGAQGSGSQPATKRPNPYGHN